MSGHHHHHYHLNQRNLFVVLTVTGTVMVVEIVGGILANSLALLSDAGHMLTDILALSLSLFAMRFAQKPPTPSKTFGYYRLEILAAFFNGMLLFFIAVYIFYEAYQRLASPEEIESLVMLSVAAIGLITNGIGILILRKATAKSLNVKSAFFHMVSDTISSVGVIVGGLIIYYTNWYLVDSLISICIGMLILRGAYSLVKESADIFLEATPKEINMEELMTDIRKVTGVQDVHHLHIWTITSGIYAMSAHVLINDQLISRQTQILREVEQLLREKYSMEHTTIQFECESCGDELLLVTEEL
ncbi:MAG: cation diffusion facilitator family transporter [Thermodesulfobacteriota bacterium]|nr:cation diffusion facilitator family transporter [Thermodesulfobacteriota bacterium]